MGNTKRKSARASRVKARAFLDTLIGEPLTFGSMLATIRDTDGYTLDVLARKLGVSRSHLCDVEKGRRGVSLDRAVRWAAVLGYPAPVFVQLALQDQVNAAGLRLRVDVKSAA